MTKRNGSGLAILYRINPVGFRSYFPMQHPRTHAPPAQKPSFEICVTVDGMDGNESGDRKTNSTNCNDEEPGNVENKKLYVPAPQKRMKKETTSAILKEAVSAFNKVASADRPI